MNGMCSRMESSVNSKGDTTSVGTSSECASQFSRRYRKKNPLDVKPILLLSLVNLACKRPHFTIRYAITGFSATPTHTENPTTPPSTLAPGLPDNYHRRWNNDLACGGVRGDSPMQAITSYFLLITLADLSAGVVNSARNLAALSGCFNPSYSATRSFRAA